MNRFLPVIGFAILLTLTGCGSQPELPARSVGNPVGVDLSGFYALRGANGERQERRIRADEGIVVPPASAAGRQQRSRRPSSGRSSRGPSVHVFIEHGRSLKVTQTEYSLFVGFDRSVVEEYTFGENQLISLGPIEAQRVSGWEGPVYVVETMDDGGVTLTETWSLAHDGRELVRTIEIVDGEEQLHKTRQVYDRQ